MASREHITFVLKNEHSTSLLKALGQDQNFKDKQLAQEIGGQVAKLDWHKVGNNWKVWLPLAWTKDWFSVTEHTLNALNPVQVAILEALAWEIRNNPVSLYHEPIFINKILRAESRIVLMTALEELIGQLQFIAEVKKTFEDHYHIVNNWWLSGQGDELSGEDTQFHDMLIYFAKYTSFLEALEEVSAKMRKAEKFMMEFIETARQAVDKREDKSFQEALDILEVMKKELTGLVTLPESESEPSLDEATHELLADGAKPEQL